MKDDHLVRLSALRCLCLQYKPKEQLTIHLMRQDCKKLGRDAWGTSSSCALELRRINHSGKQRSSGMNLKAVPEQHSEVCWRRFCCHQHPPGDSTLCYGMHNIAPCEWHLPTHLPLLTNSCQIPLTPDIFCSINCCWRATQTGICTVWAVAASASPHPKKDVKTNHFSQVKLLSLPKANTGLMAL